MIELRCRFKKAVEVDPASLHIVYKCPSCTRCEGQPVFHEWSIEDLVSAISQGDKSGVVAPITPANMVKCKE